MKSEELHRLFELENSYWWFVGTRTVIERAFRRALDRGSGGHDILDLGVGSGIMLDRICDLGPAVGLDISLECARFCHRKGHRAVVVGSAEEVPLAADSFDAVIMADVLEHCADEAAVLAELRRVLRPGGILLITVPALRLLWSHHDVAIGHYRRYRRGALVRLLNRSGFEVRSSSYFNCLLFPFFLAARLSQRVLRSRSREPRADYPSLPGLLNRLFAGLLALESRLLDRVRLPVGSSVLVIARRRP